MSPSHTEAAEVTNSTKVQLMTPSFLPPAVQGYESSTVGGGKMVSVFACWHRDLSEKVNEEMLQDLVAQEGRKAVSTE